MSGANSRSRNPEGKFDELNIQQQKLSKMKQKQKQA